MATLRSKSGLLNYHDGNVRSARYYFGEGEDEPPNHEHIDPDRYATWTEDDGTVGIRRGTSVLIGASAAYSANYDTLDWGN